MKLDYMVIDAFAQTLFGGNPAAVVWLPEARMIEDDVRQRIAGEFNLPETSFVVPLAGEDVFELRWFTPTVEVPLCGHATLAAAHALAVWEKLTGQTIRFDTRRSGRLTCTRTDGLIRMDFPALQPAPCDLPEGAAATLGVAGPVVCVGTTVMNLTLRLPDQTQVCTARPDLHKLAAWHKIGVTITAPSDDPAYDFVSRFFAPHAGIDEDPATGAAHCALGPYWAGQLGRSRLIGRQASARGGVLHVHVQGPRVELGGNAITVMQGSLHIPAS